MLLLSVALRWALVLNLPLGSRALMTVDRVEAATALAPATAATTHGSNSEPAGSLVDTFGQTRLGQLAQGKKKVSLNEIKDPAFWLDTIKDLIIAVAAVNIASPRRRVLQPRRCGFEREPNGTVAYRRPRE